MHIDDFDELSGFDEGTFGPPSQNHFPPLNSSSASEDLDFDDYTMFTEHAPKPQLRSRPPINFSGLHAAASQSHMSGSTLHSCRKAYSSLDLLPKFSPEAIASLSVLDLKHNPHYCKLRQQYVLVSQTLTTYIEKEPGPGDVTHDGISNAIVAENDAGMFSLISMPKLS
jgi:hypothetical protein